MPASSPPDRKDLAGYTFIPKTPTEEEREALLGVAKDAWGIASEAVAKMVGHFLIQPTFHIYTDQGVEHHVLDWETQEKKLSEMERMRDRVQKIGKGAYFAALVSHAQIPAASTGSLFSMAGPAQDSYDGLRVQVESFAGCLVVCTARYHWPPGIPAYLEAPAIEIYDGHKTISGPLAGFYRRRLDPLRRH